jgi:hypothetical protein
MEDEIEWLERVSPENAAKFKCTSLSHICKLMLLMLITDALDVDGNGWSSRFHRLMMSGSLVLKSTIYPEWNSVSHQRHCHCKS